MYYCIVHPVLDKECSPLPNTIVSQEAESVVAASRKAREEAQNAKQRIESNMSQLRLSTLEGDDQGAVYYGLGSTARRSSKDIDNKRESIINDDLADEIEAIRLAADFTSRRLLNEQKKEDQLRAPPDKEYGLFLTNRKLKGRMKKKTR